MAVYIGLNSEYHDKLDVIAKVLTSEDIRNILESIITIDIGSLKFVECCSNINVNDDIMTKAEALKNSSGWVFPNGKKISRSIFPDAYNYFNSINYDNKEVGSDYITLPLINSFFRINTDISNPLNPIKKVNFINELPKHKHNFDFTGQSISDEYVKIAHATYLWSSKSPTNSTDSQIIEPEYYDGILIPRTTGSHSGTQKDGTAYSFSMPIEYKNGISKKIESTTGYPINKTPDDAEVCPTHYLIPCVLYIGKPKL